MTYQTNEEIQEEFVERFIKVDELGEKPVPPTVVLNWFLSKIKAREQYLVGKEHYLVWKIEKMKNTYGKGVCEGKCQHVDCKAYNQALSDVLKLINPQESKK